ncbi:hypothetical protein ACHHYP_01027 [Achlya hypogyna]|uniref:Sphingomyelin phosphodiesterase 4 n=1 Tax=Achlya hypogyna TaxID=1202772 RepID=A0A1V9Z9F5_ACHHY|nr:hypothetical protein ACHHYP_01027 [Achlya hypogyna]
MENLKYDELLRAGEPGAMTIAAACLRLQKLLSTELSTPLHLHSVESRRKFFAFLPRFLDRVFGEEQDKQASKVSAWMTQSYGALHDPAPANSVVPKSPSAAVTGPNAHLGENGQALVQLFEKALYEFVFNISHAVRFRLDLACLPNPAQVEIRNAGSIPPAQSKLYATSTLSINGKNQCLMVPIQTYFLFSLLRYPVSTSKLKRPIAPSGTSAPASATDYWWRSFPTSGLSTLTERHPYNVLLHFYLQTFLPHGPEKIGFKSSQKQSHELFLQLLIELWLRQNQVVYEASVKVVDQYTPPTDDVLAALLLTVVHVLSDPHIPLLLHPSTHVVLKPLQKPLYDFFQIGFARASPGTNPTSFYMLADVFLAYLQPWQCVQWAATGAASPAAYSAAYAPFVLANYLFYTALLGQLVTRARDLDWDATSLDLLSRALAVYTPELLELLARADASLGQDGPGLGPAESHVLLRHFSELNLPAAAVPLAGVFRRNGEHLLDKMQYMKDVHPHRRPANTFLTSVFAPAAATESLEARIDAVGARLRTVLGIPDAYVPVSVVATAPLRSFSLASLDPAREGLLLSAAGRRQVAQGLRLCTPDAVAFAGDPMLKPISSYEVPCLVRLLYRVSMALNALLGLENPYDGKETLQEKLGAPRADAFRVNLRFLAAKANVAWLVVAVIATYLLLW